MPIKIHESASETVYWESRRHIQWRPALYIGGTGSMGLHHMFYMVLDEWLAAFAAGTQGSITVTLHPMNTISVAFSGATLPPSEITRRAATPRHARKDYRPNMTSIIDTAGIDAVNALSAFFEIQTKFGWETWQQQFAYGIPTSGVEQLKDTSKGTGVTVTFSPDRTIINAEFDYDHIAFRCRDAAYTLHGLQIILYDKRNPRAFSEEVFFADDGLADWPAHQKENGTALHTIVHAHYEDDTQHIRVELAFQFTGDLHIIERSFCNTIPTPEHGTHMDGLRAGVLAFINENMPQNYTWDNVSRGFTGAVSVFHPRPTYAGRSKVEITNAEIMDIVKCVVLDALRRQFPDGNAFAEAVLLKRPSIDAQKVTRRTLPPRNMRVHR